MNRIVFVGIFILLCLSGKSQQFFFSGYSISDGLSQSVVTCMFQDSKGYIWLGTQNGLNRFDGHSFEVFTYKPDDSTSISNNWIYGIAEDPNGNLWIGTKGGLNKYSEKGKRFERIRYTTPYSLDVTEYVYDVKCSRNGNILINTPPVLTIYDPGKKTFSHHISPLDYDGSVKDYNIPLLEDADGRIWTGSTRGLACYLPAAGSFRLCTRDPRNPSTLSHDNITALYQDKQGVIWVGTSEGLNRMSRDGKSISAYFHDNRNKFSVSNNFIRAVLGDQSGKIWIATEGGGLNCMTLDTKGEPVFEAFSAGNSGLNHNIILSLAIDRSENLWIGTLSGINKTDLKKQKFRLYRKSDSPYSVDLAGNVIASLYKDRHDAIWVGNWGQGLNILDRKKNKVEHFSSHLKGPNNLPNDFVHIIFEDSLHHVWIGTRDGLMVYQERTHSFIRPHRFEQNFGLPDFPGLRIFRMRQGKNDDFWIATQNGLFRKKRNGQVLEHFHASASPDHLIGSNLVYDVLEDSQGFIWIATTEGLDLFDPETSRMKHFRKEEGKSNSLSDNFITTLCEDHHGDIWIGTSSYVNKFQKKDSSFTYYSKEQGLPGNLVYSILEDKSHGMWFATGNGLCRYDSLSQTFHAYSVEEGLQSPEFNLGAAYLSSDGEIFFGGMNGFNAFYPDSLFQNTHVPEIVFTSAYKLKKGEKEYLEPGKYNRIVLKHNDYSFTIEFAALEFTNPSRNRYKYRLEGSDKEWIDLGNRNFVAFSNLPPGYYTLRVKGSNNDGIWNEEGVSLDILIRPPWWASQLAYFCYFLTVSLLIFLIFKRREQQHIRDRRILEAKVRERTLLIEEQKAEILEKNSELHELNASKDKFFSIIAHDLRNPFNSIIGLTDLLLMNLKSTDPVKLKKSLENIKGSSQQAHELLENLLLWARSQMGTPLAFRPEPVDLKELIREGLDLVSVQAAKKNITIHKDFDSIILPADINMIKTVVRNLLTNALKFTPQNGEVWVELSVNDNWCTLSVRDSGIGISEEKIKSLFNIDTSHKTRGTDQEPGTGLGLILCREFIEKHHGKIEVESKPGKGSLFRVILPVRM